LELHNFYISRNIRAVKSRGMRWFGNVTRMREVRNVYEIVIEKLRGKRPFGRHRLRWKHSMKMAF
jgi:hypothetical protein